MVIVCCFLVFIGGYCGGVVIGFFGWLVVDVYFVFIGRSGDGVLDVFC